jgi:DNA processing protein
MPGSPRDLLIALNAAGHDRDVVCRLGRAVERWRQADGRADTAALAAELGVAPGALARALELRAGAAALAAAERRRAAALGARIVTRLDAGYPPVVADLELPPPVLYLRGAIPDRPSVAIVGARRMDAYGREAATLFGRELAAAGVLVVSGFARGVDATAHAAALAADDGATVAVLGCGLDVDYPRGHRRLAAAIAEHGAVLSEFPCGCPPLDHHFPIRNRVIAALAIGTLVVQATLRSGSLVTARLALELGRDVWAVPGRIFDAKGEGPNGLIRDGAGLVQHPRDLLAALPLAARERLRPLASAPGVALRSASGRLLARLVPGEAQSPEGLAAAVGEGLEATLAALLELEIGGQVRRLPGGVYTRCA